MRLKVATGVVTARTAVPRPFAAGVAIELPEAAIGSVGETEPKLLMSRLPPVIPVPLSVIWPDASGWYDEGLLWKTPWPTNPSAKLPPESAREVEHAAAGGTHCW